MRYVSMAEHGPSAKWEDEAWLIIDTRDENRVVGRFCEETSFPNNPKTECWREVDRKNKAYTDLIKEVYLKENQ